MPTNDYRNPIGSVADAYLNSDIPDTIEPTPGTNDGTYDVIGKGGSIRHTGTFSPDNPAFQQLVNASNNQDKDALYEKAVQWEIDNSNTERQHAYERAMRDEQREYDSPAARIAREREAGLNSDLTGTATGSASSTGSAPMSISGRINTPTQTKFNNSYDNIALVQSGFQTAASVMSSLSSFGTSVVDSISTFKKLPSEINLADAQSSAANAAADATRQLTPIQAAAGQLQNLDSAFSLFDKASNIISPDSTLDDAKSIFTSVGIPDDQHEPLFNSIKAYHDNPAMRNYFAENERKARENEEYNKVYTQTVVSGMIEVGREIQDATLAYDKDITLLKRSVTKLLDMQQLSSDTAGAIQKGAQVTKEQMDLQYKQVQRDIVAFTNNLKDLLDAEKKSQTFIDDIKKRAKERAGINIWGKPNPVKYTPEEEAYIELEETRIKHYKSLGAMSLGECYSMMANTAQDSYYYDTAIDYYGNLKPIPGIQKHQLFMRYTWSDYSSGRVTTDQIQQSLLGRIPWVGDLARAAFEPLE